MTQLHISGLPQWLVTTTTHGIKRQYQIGAMSADTLRKRLTATADRVTITPVQAMEQERCKSK